MVAGLRYRSPQPFSTATLVSVDHLPYFDSSLVLLMDAALEAAKNHILEYYEHYQVIDVPEGATALAELPLVPAPRGKKSMKEFFHIVNNISQSDREAIVGAFVNGSLNVAALPVSIRPRDSLGESVKMQLVIEDSGDACHVLKFFHSNVEIPSGLARAWCDSRILSIDYRVANNSHLVKVAFMKMLSTVPGKQWLTQGIRAKPGRAIGMPKLASEGRWEPTEDQLREGMAFINLNAPLSNANNEQYLWVLLNVRADDSPLHGWPEHVVLKACANRTTGNSQAEPEWFFPLLLGDLNPEFLKKIVPVILPLMTSHGLMILGKAGIGKTPVAQILCMAVARHMVRSRNLEGVPGIRKSKQIDGFRDRPGEVQVPVILDDPNLASINLEDLKSFLDVGETALVDARYRAAKFARNQCRVVLNNEWDDTKEPSDGFLDHVSWDDFKGMFLTACQHPKVPHLMAVLKRTIVIIAGHHGVYLRLPNECNSEPIHCFRAGGITQDWLRATNKGAYSLFKQGVHQKYATFEEKLEEEQTLVAYLLGSDEEKKYMERAHQHDMWRAEAGQAATPKTPPAQPASSAYPAAAPPGTPPSIDMKEEPIPSPETKRPRIYGVIDVDAECEPEIAASQGASATQQPLPPNVRFIEDDADEEEDIMGHGCGLETPPQ